MFKVLSSGVDDMSPQQQALMIARKVLPPNRRIEHYHDEPFLKTKLAGGIQNIEALMLAAQGKGDKLELYFQQLPPARTGDILQQHNVP